MAKRKIILLLAIIALVFLIRMFLPGYTHLQEIKEENRRMGDEITKLEAEIAELKEKKRLLNEDPFYIEKTAREKLGVAKKGEIVYKVVEE